MGTLRILLKYFKRAIGGLLALFLIIYLIMVVVNWNDQPQSELYIKITNELKNRVKIDNASNAYVYILGFDAPPDINPLSLGNKRYAWEKKALEVENNAHSEYPLKNDKEFESGISKSINELIQACEQPNMDCLAAIKNVKNEDNVRAWFAADNWLLNRYSVLTKYKKYQNLLPYNVNTAISSLSAVLKAQKLYFIKTWIDLSENNYDSARVMLDDDLQFWRMVLLESDTLITKMIATAAIRNHFKYGNLVLHQSQTNIQIKTIPASWKIPFSIQERSLRLCLIGEWQYMDHIMRSVSDGKYQYLYGLEDPTLLEIIFSKIGFQLWKPQESSNKHLKNMMDLAMLFDVNYGEMPEGISKVDKFIEKQSKSFFNIYNPVGNILSIIALPAYRDYGIRVSDLEGIRRAVLITAEIRENKINNEVIDEFLKSSNIREPYWNHHFEWDDESNSILFYGLETGERGLHKIML